MNDAVKRRIKQMIEKAEAIKSDCDRMITELKAVETDEDLDVIEMRADSIENCAKEIYDICRNTYDEFEEE
jgi:3-dehydroquinate dehydratase